MLCFSLAAAPSEIQLNCKQKILLVAAFGVRAAEFALAIACDLAGQTMKRAVAPVEFLFCTPGVGSIRGGKDR